MTAPRPGTTLIAPPVDLRRKVGPPRHDDAGLKAMLAAIDKVLTDQRTDYLNAAKTQIRAIAIAARTTSPAVSPPGIEAQAHEIRGMAGTFGLMLTGRIADQLCRRLEQPKPVSPVVIALYAEALAASLTRLGPIDATSEAVLKGLRDVEAGKGGPTGA